MCGRARLSSDVSKIKIAFGIPPARPTPNVAASWNVAPTDPLRIVRYGPALVHSRQQKDSQHDEHRPQHDAPAQPLDVFEKEIGQG
jgi:putative SOS response-associated peptidase YedK